MADKKATATKATPQNNATKEQDFVFGKENYIMMAAGVLILIIGFTLMAGKEDIFNTTKLTVAPIMIILGFIVEVFAVMYKSKS
jgi:hypothetical protein